MFSASEILLKQGRLKLLLMSYVALTVRTVSYYLLRKEIVWLLPLIEVLHPLTIVPLVIVSVDFIEVMFISRLRASAQNLLTIVQFAITPAASSVYGTFMMSKHNGHQLYLSVAVFTFLLVTAHVALVASGIDNKTQVATLT